MAARAKKNFWQSDLLTPSAQESTIEIWSARTLLNLIAWLSLHTAAEPAVQAALALTSKMAAFLQIALSQSKMLSCGSWTTGALIHNVGTRYVISNRVTDRKLN